MSKTLEEYMNMLGFVYKPNSGGTYYWQNYNGVYKSKLGIKEAEDIYRHSIYYKDGGEIEENSDERN